MWVSVENRLPDNNELVLLYSKGVDGKDFMVNDFFYMLNGKWLRVGGRYFDNIVTHWMPIPPLTDYELSTDVK